MVQNRVGIDNRKSSEPNWAVGLIGEDEIASGGADTAFTFYKQLYLTAEDVRTVSFQQYIFPDKLVGEPNVP